MPKSSFQKLKLLYLRDYLYRCSDEQHPVTVNMMIDMLKAQGVNAERKSIYDDIELLRDYYGMDIITAKRGQYYLGEREFELPEIKLLVDTVASSKFLTDKKSSALIKKIEQFSSKYQAVEFRSQSFVQSRIKNMNESIYLTVDKIFSAINSDRKIKFKYFHYNEQKGKNYSKNGGYYTLSPFAMIIDNDYYYLAGYDEQSGIIRHFRADRIENIRLMRTKRVGKAIFEKEDYKRSDSKMFSMFSGNTVDVTMLCDNSLAGVIIDRFGKNTVFVKRDNGHFTFCAPVEVSPQFFGWVFGLGGKIEILSPQSVAKEYMDYLCAELNKYDERLSK